MTGYIHFCRGWRDNRTILILESPFDTCSPSGDDNRADNSTSISFPPPHMLRKSFLPNFCFSISTKILFRVANTERLFLEEKSINNISHMNVQNSQQKHKINQNSLNNAPVFTYCLTMFAPILMQSADLWQPPLLTRQPSISVNTQQIWNSFHDMYNMRLRQTEFRVFGCHKDETGFHLHVWLWGKTREQEDFQTCQDLKFNIKGDSGILPPAD